MININLVKQYLKVDYDDDDEIIKMLITTAESYAEGATGRLDFNEPRMKLLVLTLVKDWYDNRYFVGDKVSQSAQYTVKSIIHQLTLEECDCCEEL